LTERFLRRDVVEALLRELKNTLVELKQAGLAEEAVYKELSPLAGDVFTLASAAGYEFDEAASMVIEALGRGEAAKLVKREDVERAYGSKRAGDWARLVSG